MSHYTLQSGKRTDTVTLRCPTCRRVEYHTFEEVFQEDTTTDRSICCSEACYETYLAKLMVMFEAAKKHCGFWFTYTPEKIVIKWLTEVGKLD